MMNWTRDHDLFFQSPRFWILKGPTSRSEVCAAIVEDSCGEGFEKVVVQDQGHPEVPEEADAALFLLEEEHPHLGPHVFWSGLLVHRLHEHFRGAEGLPPLPASLQGTLPSEVGAWLPSAVLAPTPLRYWWADFGEWWASSEEGGGQPLVLLYDDLTGFKGKEVLREWRLLRSLLSFWMDKTCQGPNLVCPKLFFREDVFRDAISKMVDAPKLDSRARRF